MFELNVNPAAERQPLNLRVEGRFPWIRVTARKAEGSPASPLPTSLAQSAEVDEVVEAFMTTPHALEALRDWLHQTREALTAAGFEWTSSWKESTTKTSVVAQLVAHQSWFDPLTNTVFCVQGELSVGRSGQLAGYTRLRLKAAPDVADFESNRVMALMMVTLAPVRELGATVEEATRTLTAGLTPDSGQGSTAKRQEAATTFAQRVSEALSR